MFLFIGVTDADTSPENVTIRISALEQCGFLSLKSNLSKSITTFTQADVDSHNVYFTHTGNFLENIFELLFIILFQLYDKLFVL